MDDKTLEQEIGSLGQLENKEQILGGLSKEETQSMETFLERGRRERDNNKLEVGWIKIDRSELGERSLFYPEEWDFYIKPASVASIKGWTAADDERPDVVNEILNEILKGGLKIDTKTDTVTASWKHINSWDRFWFVLKIREATFVNGESKVDFDDECSDCGETIKFTLNPQSLIFNIPDKELLENFYSDGVWSIDTTEFGLLGEGILTLYNPTLGKDAMIIEWAKQELQNKKKVDEQFIKYLMWAVNILPKNLKQATQLYNNLYIKYKSFTPEMFYFLQDVLKNISVDSSENLQVKCPVCGGTVESNVRFPQGIGVLFKTNTMQGIKKFGSR